MRDPKGSLLESLKALGWSALTVVIGVVILAAATASSRVYPVPALVGGIAAIVGAIGCVVTLLMTLVRLVQWLRAPASPTSGIDVRPTSGPAEWPPRRVEQPPSPVQRVPPRPVPQPASPPSPTPAPPPPAPVAPDERPTTIPAPVASHPVDDLMASLFAYKAPNEDYSTWTTEALRDQLQGLDQTAMGMALHMGGVPDGMVQQMNEMNAELSRREQPGGGQTSG
jgi:hypothetical protein